MCALRVYQLLLLETNKEIELFRLRRGAKKLVFILGVLWLVLSVSSFY